MYLYTYCINNPVRFTDPWGLSLIPVEDIFPYPYPFEPIDVIPPFDPMDPGEDGEDDGVGKPGDGIGKVCAGAEHVSGKRPSTYNKHN